MAAELERDITVGRPSVCPLDLSRGLTSRSLDHPRCWMPTVRCGNRLVLDWAADIRGLVMPMSVGFTVREQLRQRGRLGPVIGHPGSRRVTILTCLPDGTEQTYGDRLFALNVSVASGSIALPMPGDDRFREWIESPENGFVPPMGDVIYAVLGLLR
ncbi:hypothetical protein [Nocardia sp. NPDC050710]|uniref:hypothetical protein n=1 Tax=Nocardia sp. NPDC050710 TaxID=3157220 RepID=UPI0033E272BA